MSKLAIARSVLVAVTGFVWAVTFGALRDFVWADIRDGMIRIDGFARGTRLTVGLGFALIFGLIGALFFNDVWRAQSALVAMPTVLGMQGRGSLVPVALVPLTFALLAVAWSYALNGLLHSHAAARVGILLLYVVTSWQDITLLTMQVGWGIQSPGELIARAALLLGVPLFFVIRWRRPARPALEFVILLALVAAPAAITQARGYADWRMSGVPLLFVNLQSDLLSFRLLVTPLLLLIGIDVANFARQMAGWSVDIVRERLPRLLSILLLLAVLVWRLFEVILPAIQRFSGAGSGQPAAEYISSLIELLIIVGMGWLMLRPRAATVPAISDDDLAETVQRIALPLILLYVLLQLIAFALLSVGNAIPLAGLVQVVMDATDILNDQLTDAWRHAILICALGAALWVALGRSLPRLSPTVSRAAGLYLGILGGLGIWYALIQPGGLLQALGHNSNDPLDFWLTALLAAAAIWAFARRTLTSLRAQRLLFALILIALLRQTAFIAEPFRPFLGFAGVGFVAFGVAWNVLTGASWVNNDSAALPRAGRVFLYVGYALLTITVVNWALTSHDIGMLEMLTGGATEVGFSSFGKPLLYAVIATAVLQPVRQPPTPDTHA